MRRQAGIDHAIERARLTVGAKTAARRARGAAPVSAAPNPEAESTSAARAPDLVGIFRRHHPDRGGYYLHVSLQRQGKIFQKYFNERRNGGEQATLTLARAWRDGVIAAYPAMPLGQFCGIVRINNTSGVSGVSRAVKGRRRKDGGVLERAYWCARVPLAAGRYRYRSFSVAVYGEDGAWQRAVDARLRGLAELDGILYKADRQIRPASTAADFALLDARLRAPEERRQQRADARQARLQSVEQRAAQRLALAQAAEDAALAGGGEPYIGRYTNANGVDRYWRVSMVRQGSRHRKTFSDSVHGGAAPALLAAKAWRDQLFLALPVENKASRAARVNAANTSGVAGVNRARTLRNGEAWDAWVAHGPKVKGLPSRSKKFSVAKYGEERAFALAVEARAAFVAEFSGTAYWHHRSARKMRRALDPAPPAAAAGEAAATPPNQGRRAGTA
ncbi:hypothetical protein ACFDR9_003162 [Janthinobacterium sp. CG_23.3]|uniref:hypothetical protein n=1 Tax=Janthinobacterium sp. CG_23.3 TaxID=3349634 RepID=UPI0038D43715